MSLTLTAGLQAAKDNLSKKPLWILEFDFTTGTIYVSSQTKTITGWTAAGGTVVLTPLVRGWGKLDDAMPSSPFEAPIYVGDFSAHFKVHGGPAAAGSLYWYLAHPANYPEQTTVKLFEWEESLNAATDPPVERWEGRIEDYHFTDEHTIFIRFTDRLTRADKILGTLITNLTTSSSGYYANATKQSIGNMIPLIYGTVSGVPAQPVNAGAFSTLARDIVAGSTVIYYSDPNPPDTSYTTTLQPNFPASGTIQIDGEQIAYSAKGSTTTTVGGGSVVAIQITTAGSGYSVGSPPTVGTSGGGGTGLVASVTIDPTDGSITNCTVLFGGTGFTSTPSITLSGGTAPTVAAVMQVQKNSSGTTIGMGAPLVAGSTITVGFFTVASTAVTLTHRAGAQILQVLSQWDFVVANHICKTIQVVYVDKIRVGFWTQVTDGNGNTIVRFTTYPTVAKKVALSQTGDVAGVSQMPITWTTTTLGIFFGGQTSVQFATFTAVFGMYKALYHLEVSTTTAWTVNFSSRIFVYMNGTVIFDSNINSTTSSTIVFTTTNLSDALTLSFTGGGVAASVTMKVDHKLQRTPMILGALAGMQSADTVVSQTAITCDVKGYQDDGGGTYTGSASALINTSRDVMRHLAVVHGGYAFANVVFAPTLAARMGSTFNLNGALTTRDKFVRILGKMAWESGLLVHDVAGNLTITQRQYPLTPDFVVPSNKLRFFKSNRQTLERKPIPMTDIINRVWAAYNRNYNWRGTGDPNGYQQMVQLDDTASQTRYGIQERPELFLLDWVTDSAHATAIATLYYNLFRVRREYVKFRQGMQGLGKVFGDVVRIQDRLLPYGTGQLLGVDLEPGDGQANRKTNNDLTFLMIQEGESMLSVYDKTSNYTLVNPQDQHSIFTNTGAAGSVTFTLPAMTRGQRYGPFYVMVANTVVIAPATGEKLALGFEATSTGSTPPTPLAANVTVSSITPRSWISFLCLEDGVSQVERRVGTWST